MPFTLGFNSENDGVLASEANATRALRSWCGLRTD
jgi:hypothetical protein